MEIEPAHKMAYINMQIHTYENITGLKLNYLCLDRIVVQSINKSISAYRPVP